MKEPDPRLGASDESLFVAQSACPAELKPLDFASLTPFHRALLVIDGTVTQFIEAYTLEPVHVLCGLQEWRQLEEDHPWLEAPKNERIIFRQVTLRGAESGALYAQATSLIAFDRLTKEMQEGVSAPEQSLGRLLRQHRVETHRELLWRGWAHPADIPGGGDAPYLHRTYRMIACGKPIMLIAENFPVERAE